MENKEIVIVDSEIKDLLVGLTEDKATELTNVFLPRLAVLRELEGRFNEIVSKDINKETCNESKDLRLIIRKIRTGAEKDRKTQKAGIVRAGKAIDGLFHLVEYAVVSKEEKLKEIETHFERLEEEKIRALKAERTIEISKYLDEDYIPQGLGTMDDSVWENYLSGTKANFEAAREAERKTEEDRILKEKKAQLEHDRRYQTARLVDFIYDYENVVFSDLTEEKYNSMVKVAIASRTAHEEKQEKIRLENIRLKEEAEKAEEKRLKEISDRKAKEKKEEEVREKERLRVQKEREEENRINREAEEKREKELEAEREKQRILLENERKEKDRIIKEQEEKRLKDEADLKAAEMAPDKEKLEALMIQFDSLWDNLSSKEAKKAVEEARKILESAVRGM